ncbi:MAG: hypothetical protein IKU96_04095 [Alistipes sp.]|nr:hypothetical protein [Alistipes sp.]
MKIKNLLLALLALPLFFVACDNDNPQVDEILEPTVEVTAGEATENSLTFTVASTEAEKVAYLVVEGAEVPTASEVLANGTSIEVNKSVALTATDLKAETEYTIVAAAQNVKAVVKATASMTTAKGGETPGPDPKPEPDTEAFVATYIVTDYANEEGMHIYVFELGDMDWGSNGWGIDGGTYYSFAIISSAKGNGVLPNGTYSLSNSYSANTIVPDYAYRYQMADGTMVNGFELYKDANVVITNGKIEANIELERDGSIHKVVFEGDLAVEDGGSQQPSEFEATHTADKWLWGGSSNWGNKYQVVGENFSVDVHFMPSVASESAITAGRYAWVNTTIFGSYADEFTTRTLTVDGASVAVDAGEITISNEGEQYHIEMTLEGRDGFVYMIEYNGKLNDKGDVGGEGNTLVINTLGKGSYNGSYYFYTFKAAGDNFSFDLALSDYHAKEEIINAGTYQCAPSVSYAGNQNMFYANNFKYDGVSYKPTEASTMVVEGDGTNVSIRMNLVMQSGDAFVVTYNGKVGGSTAGAAPTKLETPTPVTMVSGNAVTVGWNEIAGAKDYTVTLNGSNVKTVGAAYITYDNLEWETTYTVSVVANPADATANSASDAGTTTFTTEANPGGGDEGGSDEPTSETTLKFVKDLTSVYGSGYESYCYYELTSGNDVIGFWIFNNKSDKSYLYDGTYTNGTSLNYVAYNTSSGVFIEDVTIDGQYISRTNNGGSQTSSTIVVAEQGGNVTINLDYVDEYATSHSRTYTFSGTIAK